MSSKSTRSTKDGAEEPKKTLPPGHPQAGYYGPDLSFRDSPGVLPPDEQAWHDEANDAHVNAVSEVEEHEDRVATLIAAGEDGSGNETLPVKSSRESSSEK